MNNREKTGEIPDPNSAEWARQSGTGVGLTVVASVASSLCFLCLHPGCQHPPSCSPRSYMTSVYNVPISFSLLPAPLSSNLLQSASTAQAAPTPGRPKSARPTVCSRPLEWSCASQRFVRCHPPGVRRHPAGRLYPPKRKGRGRRRS